MKQESIDSAFDPTNIAKKKEKHEAAQKLPPEVQARINLRVFNYVVADALPLSTVESEHFRDLIREIDTWVQVVCGKTLKENIAADFLKYKDDLRGNYQSAIDICLTVDDAWGSKHRSFLGVTAHWFLAVLAEKKTKQSFASLLALRANDSSVSISVYVQHWFLSPFLFFNFI